MNQQPTVDDLTEEQRLRYNHTLIQGLQDTIEDGKEGLDGVPKYIRKVIREKAWEIRVVRQTGEIIEFDTFTEFVEAHPPGGLNTTIDMLRRMCDEDPEAVRMLREVTTGKPGNPTGANQHTKDERGNVDNVNSSSSKERSSGNSKDYRLDRLHRERPDLYEKVVGDEMSAHAAAVEAGFATKTASVPVRKGGRLLYERAAKAIAKRFDVETFIEHLREHL